MARVREGLAETAVRAVSGISTNTVTVAVGQKCTQAFGRNAYPERPACGRKGF